MSYENELMAIADNMPRDTPQSFYAVVPAPVLEDQRLPDGAKLFYAVITTLMKREGYAWASNTYLSKISGRPVTTVRNWLRALTAAGYIEIEVHKPSGNRRRIYLTPMSKIGHSSVQNWTGHLSRNNGVGTKKKTPLPPLPYGSCAFHVAWEEWMQHRREQGKTLTPTAIKRQFAKLLEMESEDRAVKAIHHSIEKSYTGIYEPPKPRIGKHQLVQQPQLSRTEQRQNEEFEKHYAEWQAKKKARQEGKLC